MFDLDRITASALVATIDYHESLGSTNDRALELASQGETDLPLLVLTERQTDGRGRGTNRWWTATGSLTFSLVVDAPPDRLPAERWPLVALVGGLAVCEALEVSAPGAELRVKWPNDVYLGERKICGILCESVLGWRGRLVVGIGINVNNSMEGTGDRGQGKAVALVDYDGLSRDMTSALLAVLDQFELRWRELLQSGFSTAAKLYQQRCFLTSKTVKIEQAGGRTLSGVCHGIDEAGALRLGNETGEVQVVSGSVSKWS